MALRNPSVEKQKLMHLKTEKHQIYQYRIFFVLFMLKGTTDKHSPTSSSNCFFQGLSVHDIPTLEIETVLKAIAVADDKGSFFKSLLLAHHLIDFFVPFFPLDENHVRCCIRHEVKRRFGNSPKDSIVESILKTIKFVPEYDPKFADMGCKSLRRAIAMQDISHSGDL